LAKILIADEDRDYRELVIFILRFAGYEMYGASCGDDCLTLARQHKPDLILLGLDLPDKGSFDTCSKLKADPITASIPVLTLLDPGEVERAKADLDSCGAGYLLTSLSSNQLTRSVESFLRTQ
jgi:two-component system, cell cycle response regulator